MVRIRLLRGWAGLDLIGFNFPSKASSEESLMLSPANGKINEKRNDGCVRTIDICHKGHSFNVVGLQDLSNSSKKPMETGRSGICSNSVRAKTSLASTKCNFVERLDSILKT